MKLKGYMDSGKAKSQADLARQLGVSRAKVTQMLNLLELDDEIRDFLLNLDDEDGKLLVLTERRLRDLRQVKDAKCQRDEFWRMIQD